MKLQGFVLAISLIGSTFATLRPRSGKLEACPLLGQPYPPPKSIASEPRWAKAAKSLDATLDQKVATAPYKGTTFSVGIFSASDDEAFYQYHHTSAAVANSTYGTNKVDGDSIYRIGSISKLLTVYMFLISEGDLKWSDPVAKHLPQLLKYKSESWNDITPDWNSITVGDLAGQMAGLARDYGLDDLAPSSNGLLPIPEAAKAAFPDIPQSQAPKCGWSLANQTLVKCSADEYLAGAANESPIFSAAYTPVYSNEGFAILGLVLQKITGTPIESLFNETYAKTLGLSSTYFDVPDTISENDVIPKDPVSSGWHTEFGVFAPAGGYLSSLNDFTKIGKYILNNRFLPKTVTDRWLKPTSFVESWSSGVGRPWEIFRFKVNGQSVDIYSKSGDWGLYHTFLGVVPAYHIGITVLTAQTLSSSAVRDELPLVLGETVLPIIDQIAREQATKNFAGHYSSEGTNSSLTLSTGGNQTGLKVTQMTSNGVDVYQLFESLVPSMVWRLQPNQLNYGDDKVGFTSYQMSATPPSNDASLLACSGWFDVDQLTYGNIPLGQMAFDVDSSGKSTAVNFRGFRTTLKKAS